MMEASLTILIPDSWVKDIGQKFPTPIKFVDCMPYGEGGGRGLIEIEDDPDVTEAVIEEIESHPNVYRVEVSHFGDGKISGSVITNKCVACTALTGSECFLTSARSIGEGKVEWRIMTGGEGSFATLVKNLKSVGCEVQINKVNHVGDHDIMTRRQEEIVKAALERGYYDYPRRTTIRKLARELNISHSTLGEILQRGEKNIVESFFKAMK